MDPNRLSEKLIKAARLDVPSDAVPYAFEKRVMANLGQRRLDQMGFWAQSLWRAVVPCAAIALLLGAWSFTANNDLAQAPDEFAQHFETTVLAGGTAAESLADYQ